jgi:RNA polymerase sigma-70 factor (ECF subfamily)
MAKRGAARSHSPGNQPAGRRADPEADLLARVAARDEAALIALYAQTAGTVHACCLRILRDPEDAKDVTSETFWRLWCRAASFDPERCSAMAWILTIARRLALDRRRSLLRRGRFLDRLSAQPAPPEDTVTDAIARREIASALNRLPQKDRQLLETAYFRGLSGADIAARDAIPLGTVKSRMRAALARLRISMNRGNP